MIKKTKESSKIFKKQKDFLKFILISSLIVFFFIFFNVMKILIQNQQENAIIADLQDNLSQINKENGELKELIQISNNPTTKESIIRTDLNMKLNGENVVVINDKKLELNINELDKNSKKIQKTYKYNYEKWIDFFFKE